jgi:hypothetical protein
MRVGITLLIIGEKVLVFLEFFLSQGVSRILLPLVKEGRKFRVEFFCSSSQVGNDSCIRCISLESRSVQGKIVMYFFQEKCPFVNIVNGVFGVDAG